MEFALTLPVFVVIIGGLVVLNHAMSAVADASEVASTVGDLTSQMTTVTPADLSDEFTVANIMMGSLPTASLSLRVTDAEPVMSGSVVTAAKVGWCQAYGQGLPCPAQGSTIHSFPNGAQVPLAMLTGPSSSFIISEASYTYTTPPPVSLPGGLQIYKVKFISPRTTTEVLCPTC